MDKLAQAKRMFYSTLSRNNISPEEYLYTDQGLSLLKLAANISRPVKNEKRASMWDLIEAVITKSMNPKDPMGKALSAAALGTLGGYGTGAVLGRLTSPTSTTIGNLQKKELISEYDTAIAELQNRLAARSIR